MRNAIRDNRAGLLSAQAFIELLGSRRSEVFVANLTTTITHAHLGGALIPCSVNDGAPTCYICCPSAAYVDYASVEIKALHTPWIVEAAIWPLLRLGRILIQAAGLDRQVQPNNWLVATNPPLWADRDDLAELVGDRLREHPGHVVLWRSLNLRSDSVVMETMRMAGWTFLPSRMVYLFDCRTAAPKIGRDEARDKAILDAGGYEIVEGDAFHDDDFERGAALYAMLYLKKYTPLNPHYTPAFIAGLARGGILEVKGLRNANGSLDGIIGFLDGSNVMTAPIVGYDTSLPQDVGLYRMLMAIAFDRARTRHMLFNASAGADAFKRNRGAEPVLEYCAVYNRHLSLPRRAALRILATLLTRIGVPILETYIA